VRRIEPTQDGDNPKLWVVRVEYDTEMPEEEDPFDRPPEYSWTFAQFQKVAALDINGNAIVNSAGQYFDPPIEIDDSRPVLTIVRNEIYFNPAIAIAYQDAINSEWFFGFAPGVVKVANISAVSQVEDDYPSAGNKFYYWKVTYEFMMRRGGWTLQLLDQGRFKISAVADGDVMLEPIRDADLQPVTDPLPLNGSGQPIDEPGPTNCVFLPYQVYQALPFTAFGF
jgi:hypothetical protein